MGQAERGQVIRHKRPVIKEAMMAVASRLADYTGEGISGTLARQAQIDLKRGKNVMAVLRLTGALLGATKSWIDRSGVRRLREREYNRGFDDAAELGLELAGIALEAGTQIGVARGRKLALLDSFLRKPSRLQRDRDVEPDRTEDPEDFEHHSDGTPVRRGQYL